MKAILILTKPVAQAQSGIDIAPYLAVCFTSSNVRNAGCRPPQAHIWASYITPNIAVMIACCLSVVLHICVADDGITYECKDDKIVINREPPYRISTVVYSCKDDNNGDYLKSHAGDEEYCSERKLCVRNWYL